MIGIVAIGRNEGERLRACLMAAVAVRDAVVVYVDSGSTDGSCELAQSHGAHVVNLDLSTPFTAARARNEGFARLISIRSGLQFVQFLDGDCELQPGWMDRATSTLLKDSKIAAVCGRRRERYPDKSIYNQLCDLEWDTPVGIAKSCGGDAMIRISAFQQVNGYNPDVIAGEEPEMCVRLRAAGYEIHRIDAEMTLHDASMTHFSQWWKRNIRAGHAYAEGYHRHGAAPEFFAKKQVRSNVFWSIPIFWIAWPVLWYKIYQYKPNTLYATFTVIGKIPTCLGQCKFWWNQWRGNQSKIIEYKGAGT